VSKIPAIGSETALTANDAPILDLLNQVLLPEDHQGS
jgi:hypothetical protein